MFGYVTVNPKQLTEAQLSRYRAWYCGLCRSLKERYGQTGRLSLSNDMTFLAVLLSSLYMPAEKSGEEICPVHPVKKRKWTRSAMTDYAADMNYLLAYWKCLDNSRDDGDLLQKRLARSMEKEISALEAKYPRQCRMVSECLDEIHRIEDSGTLDADGLCALSGRMLQEVFVPREDAFAPILRAVGNGLGRFIYLMDAWEDLDEDIRKKRYNPLAELKRQGDYEELIRETLMTIMGETTEACGLLPLEQDMDLIRHVLYHGVWSRYALITDKKDIKLTESLDESLDCEEVSGA